MKPLRQYLRFSLLELLACVVLLGIGLFVQAQSAEYHAIELHGRTDRPLHVSTTYGWPFTVVRVMEERGMYALRLGVSYDIELTPRIRLHGPALLLTALFWLLLTLWFVWSLRILSSLKPRTLISAVLAVYAAVCPASLFLAKIIQHQLLGDFCISILPWCWLFLAFLILANLALRRLNKPLIEPL